MSLVHLPHAIWQDVLINWLGDIKDIACFDCAYAIFKLRTDSLGAVYTGRAFPLYDGSYCPGDPILARFCSWMRSKTVYINHLGIFALDLLEDALLPWDDIMTWSGKKITSMSMKCSGLSPASRFSSACSHLARLQKLKFSGTSSPHPATTVQLLQNNADTLTSLLFYGPVDDIFDRHLDIPLLPRLQVLQCPYFPNNTVGDLLRKCPNLTALSLVGDDQNCASLLSIAAECCPLLQRLEGIEGLTYEQLLQLAHGCPSIEYLGMTDCHDRITAGFAEVIQALPRLHTLVVRELPETVLSAIANGGAPSLRVLNLFMGVTYDSLRRHFAALPQLTALTIRFILGAPDCTDLFEYCGNLEILHIRGWHTPEDSPQARLIANTAILSVATYCHNLHTLVLGSYMPFSPAMIHTVLKCCPKLRRVQIMKRRGNSGDYNDARVVFSKSYCELSKWLPAGAD